MESSDMNCPTLDERVELMRSGEIPLPPPPAHTKGNGHTLKAFICIWRRVPLRNWAWVHFYFAFAAWTFVLWQHPPGTVNTLQGHPLIDIWTVTSFIGALLGSIGLIFEAQGKKWIGFGAGIELMGHIAMAISPIIYGMTQIGLIVQSVQHPELLAPGMTPLDRLHLPFLSYVALSALLVRAVVVIPRFRKEATDSNKMV